VGSPTNSARAMLPAALEKTIKFNSEKSKIHEGNPSLNDLPSRELTYPTLGKGKSSSNCHFGGICDRYLEGNFCYEKTLYSYKKHLLIVWILAGKSKKRH